MLLTAEAFAAIKSGAVDTVFRRWRKATVRAGGTLTSARGVLAIDSLKPIAAEDVTLADARRAGFESLPAFHAWLATMKEGDLCIMRVRYIGDDPRQALREKIPDAGEFSELTHKLERLDGNSPWTAQVLDLIAQHPGRLAADLAAEIGWERDPFKERVRKLGALGLTESLDVGYRLSPRGEAVLSRRRQPAD